MIRIIRQWESIILCNIQGIMENGMTLCAITDIMVKGASWVITEYCGKHYMEQMRLHNTEPHRTFPNS